MSQAESITLFLSYAEADEASRLELEKHLKLLLHQNIIKDIWHRRRISAGADLVHEVHNELERASVILLLISPDFMDSDYCYSDEMKRAIDRHEANKAKVFPILVRPYDLQNAPFADLPMLPSNTIPIKNWSSEDAAWAEVVRYIRVALQGQLESSLDSSQQQTPILRQSKGLPKWRKAQIALTLALVCLLVTGGLIYKNIHDNSPADSATITIAPDSQPLDQQVKILATTGTPDESQHQIKAREISDTKTQQPKTVKATGIGTIPGTGKQARGELQVRNYGPASVYVSDGQHITSNVHHDQNPDMILDFESVSGITIPAPPPGTPYASQTVRAHVDMFGLKGNVDKYIDGSDGYEDCPTNPSGCTAFVKNTPFTGGVNPQTYTFVQQSDINEAMQQSSQQNRPEAQTMLKSKMQPNEDWIGTPSCNPQPPVSDHAMNNRADTVTVTVSYLCTGQVYDQEAMRKASKQKLIDQTKNNPGKDYALSADTTAVIQSTQIATDGTGMIVLPVEVKGTWIYQLNDEQKQKLAKLLVGKTEAEAQQILLKQKGIKQVRGIQLVGDGQNILPTTAQKIHFTS